MTSLATITAAHTLRILQRRDIVRSGGEALARDPSVEHRDTLYTDVVIGGDNAESLLLQGFAITGDVAPEDQAIATQGCGAGGGTTVTMRLFQPGLDDPESDSLWIV